MKARAGHRVDEVQLGEKIVQVKGKQEVKDDLEAGSLWTE